ncbi:MAG: homocysteine S-methyltransferase family protein [Treponema sp.]|uniref:homocysteine S-methyltransferase family protein n=1 Tax=Treponema sp. TaxID=166 RepID=UPI00298D8F0A|nr:homocysteine S-methyltransferase family protein [Treponema sp.]MCQ2600647.1 homocysteine S-methyltransferase family protein [Treponema sp.]
MNTENKYNIRDYLGKEVLFFDGGTGSVLQARGLKPGELPENWNIEKPEEIVQLNYSYFLAGSNIVNTNSFGAFSTKFTGKDGTYPLEQIVTSAVENAKEARRRIYEKDEERGISVPRFIALDIGSCGKLLKPLGDLEFEDAVTLFKTTFLIGLKCNPDLILIETINDLYEAKAAVIAAKEAREETGADVPIIVSTVYDEGHKSLTGSSPEIVSAVMEGLGVDALGMNCSLGPVQMKPIVTRLLEATTLPVLVKPNAGLPRSVNGQTVYDVDDNEFAQIVAGFVKEGAMIVGGCCGTNPSYIKKLVDNTDAIKGEINSIQPKTRKSVITSGTKIVEFGKAPILIGERINPTGKKKLKAALVSNDISYILNEGITQEEKGAQVLDVNVGLPEIDECQMMQTVIKELQAVTDLPLQIDTSDPVTMEKALRLYNGKPLINSVNGKQEVMKEVFPLVKKYGGIVVALALDEQGIPPTAEERIKIVEKLYNTAAEYGIDPCDVMIDPLAMTVSADDQAAVATLATVKYVKEVRKGLTILGVSNVSFGLPLREHITSIFFTMAMQNGLSAAIMNPNAQEMMKAWTCFKTISGLDGQCLGYIDFAGKYEAQMAAKIATGAPAQGAASPASNTATDNQNAGALSDPLIKAIVKGLKENSKHETENYFSGANGKQLSAMEIINDKIIPALDIIGKDFEQKKAYLPQLLMAADAAKEAFAVIKDELNKRGVEEESKGTVVIATVKGDIHDIGKNIVKVLLENYSFKVIDCGKDVPPETVLEAVIREHAPLAGLSALMTTTVGAMEETIKLIHEKAPWCKVFVGGAVLNQDYADQIHADQYTKDAMDSVKYCQTVMAEVKS